MKPLKWLRRVGGTVLFMVGMVALLLPILPGWFLIACGLYLLAVDSPGMQQRIAVIRARHPLFDRLLVPIDRFAGKKSTPAPPEE